MSVDPPKSNALPNENPGCCGSTSDAPCPGVHPTVESSSEADRVPEGTVSPERMREVLRRLDQGHYGSPEVEDKVAQAVLRDLGLSRTE
jgi:hypothetical protein